MYLQRIIWGHTDPGRVRGASTRVRAKLAQEEASSLIDLRGNERVHARLMCVRGW